MKRGIGTRKAAHKRGGASGGDSNAVGYRKPPMATRFKPGVSGNPNGRRKGSKNLKTLIKEALTAKVVIQEGSKSRQVSKFEGVILRQLQNALKGNDRAAMAVFKMATELDFLEDNQANPAEAAAALSSMDEQILEQLLPPKKAKRR
jgi:hypothetical protein